MHPTDPAVSRRDFVKKLPWLPPALPWRLECDLQRERFTNH
jgi:hypothetical protein